jgi:hypothetical protein
MHGLGSDRKQLPRAKKPGRITRPLRPTRRDDSPSTLTDKGNAMQTLYPCEQASTLLANLAANEAARRQLLADPQATLRAYGFEIDASALPTQIELAGNGEYETALTNLDQERLQQEMAKRKLVVFLLK